MIYTLRHRTTYRYAKAVRFARCSLRLKPQDGEGQGVLASAVTIDPSPATAAMRRDYLGIEAVAITLDAPHTEFRVEALSTVRVERPAPPPPEAGRAWETVRDAVVASRELDGRAPVHFLYPTGRVPLVPAVTAYARESFSAGRSAYGAAHDLMLRIRADFRFDAKATTVHTPLAEAFALRAGVCQDFAHVMIAGLRGMGLPAAYVSGYLRTVPPPGRARRAGAGARPPPGAGGGGGAGGTPGSASTRPTAWRYATITSWWRGAATTATSRPSTASSAPRAGSASRSRST